MIVDYLVLIDNVPYNRRISDTRLFSISQLNIFSRRDVFVETKH